MNNKKIIFFSVPFFFSLTIAIVVAFNKPSYLYEYSIYSYTPIFTLITIIASIIYSIIEIIISIKNKNNVGLFIGFLLLFISNAILFMLPIIRGYNSWNLTGDTSFHLAEINVIISSGRIPSDNIYPIMHIIGTQIALISSIDIIKMSMILPYVFYLSLFILSSFLVFKKIAKNREETFIFLIIILIPIAGWYNNFIPNYFANFLLPFVLYLILNFKEKKDGRWALIVVPILIILPLFHLVTTFAIIIFLLSLSIEKSFLSCDVCLEKRMPLTIPGLLIVISTLTWITSFFVWDRTVKNINMIIMEGGTSHLDRIVSDAMMAEGMGIDLLRYFAISYFGILILSIITVSYIIYAYYYKIKLKNKYLFIWLILIVALISILFLTNVGFSPLRLLYYYSYVIIIISSIPIYQILIVKKRNLSNISSKIFTFFILSLLIILSVWGVFILYPSDINAQANMQTTDMEIQGYGWIVVTNDRSLEITGITASPGRVIDFLSDHSIVYPQHFDARTRAPLHFGYNKSNSEMGTNYIGDIYMILIYRDYVNYEKTYPKLSEFFWTESDFKRIEYDNSVSKIYNSPGFCEYIII